MFRQLAREVAKRPPHGPPSAPPQPHPLDLFLYHPIQLAGLLLFLYWGSVGLLFSALIVLIIYVFFFIDSSS